MRTSRTWRDQSEEKKKKRLLKGDTVSYYFTNTLLGQFNHFLRL